MNFRGAKVVKLIEIDDNNCLVYIKKKNPPMKVDSKNTNDEKKFILCFFKH